MTCIFTGKNPWIRPDIEEELRKVNVSPETIDAILMAMNPTEGTTIRDFLHEGLPFV